MKVQGIYNTKSKKSSKVEIFTMVKIQNICRGSYKKRLLDIFSTSCDQPTTNQPTTNQLTNELKNIGRRFSIGRPKSDFFYKNNLVGHFATSCDKPTN